MNEILKDLLVSAEPNVFLNYNVSVLHANVVFGTVALPSRKQPFDGALCTMQVAG